MFRQKRHIPFHGFATGYHLFPSLFPSPHSPSPSTMAAATAPATEQEQALPLLKYQVQKYLYIYTHTHHPPLFTPFFWLVFDLPVQSSILCILQTWVLKVSIHCKGCQRKVKRVLQTIEGTPIYFHLDLSIYVYAKCCL